MEASQIDHRHMRDSRVHVAHIILETGIGGVKTYRTLEGGELAPKVAPRRLGVLTPNWRFSIESL